MIQIFNPIPLVHTSNLITFQSSLSFSFYAKRNECNTSGLIVSAGPQTLFIIILRQGLLLWPWLELTMWHDNSPALAF